MLLSKAKYAFSRDVWYFILALTALLISTLWKYLKSFRQKFFFWYNYIQKRLPEMKQNLMKNRFQKQICVESLREPETCQVFTWFNAFFQNDNYWMNFVQKKHWGIVEIATEMKKCFRLKDMFKFSAHINMF